MLWALCLEVKVFLLHSRAEPRVPTSRVPESSRPRACARAAARVGRLDAGAQRGRFVHVNDRPSKEYVDAERSQATRDGRQARRRAEARREEGDGEEGSGKEDLEGREEALRRQKSTGSGSSAIRCHPVALDSASAR